MRAKRIRKSIVCKVCNAEKGHIAHGMCKKCYSKDYYKTHTRKLNEMVCIECGEIKDCGSHGMCKKCYKLYFNEKKYGRLPYNKNKSCSMFLGCHVAERVLSLAFKNVERQPLNNPGYDFICNKGMKIDVKSTCVRRNGKLFTFKIRKNKIADFFLCIGFDNIENLNPIRLWLIPGNIVNKNGTASISESTIEKWNEYEIDIEKTKDCCKYIKI